MNFEEIKSKFKTFTSEIKEENFLIFYDKFHKEISEYKKSGGLGKPLRNFLYNLWKENEGDIYKDEVLGEILNRMEGYCSPQFKLVFKDFKKGKY